MPQQFVSCGEEKSVSKKTTTSQGRRRPEQLAAFTSQVPADVDPPWRMRLPNLDVLPLPGDFPPSGVYLIPQAKPN